MRLFIGFILLALPLQSLAQTPEFEWVVPLRGTTESHGKAIAVDSLDFIVQAGIFAGGTDFDPGPGTFVMHPEGGFDIYLQKLGSDGFLIWARQIGGSLNEDVHDLELDEQGNIYITGSFEGSADFQPHQGEFLLVSNGGKDAYLAKYDSFGNFVWARSFGGPGEDIGKGIELNNQGEIVVTGEFEQSVDFDPSDSVFVKNSTGGSDIFVSHFESNGQFISTGIYGGLSDESVSAMIRDDDNFLYLAGSFQDSMLFSTDAGIDTIVAQDTLDAYICKIDQTTKHLWTRQYRSSQSVFVNSISGQDDLLVVAGQFASEIDLDLGAGVDSRAAIGGEDAFIQAIDTSGTVLWSHTIGGASNDAYTSVDIDENLVVACGTFEQQLDFDYGPTNDFHISNGGTDVFVQRLSTSGTYIETQTIGGDFHELADRILLTHQKDIVLSGSFSTTVDFDPGAGVYERISGGGFDSFLLKLTLGSLQYQELDAYQLHIVNPAIDQLIIYNTEKHLLQGSLINSLGSEVAHLNSDQEVIELSLIEIPPGMYFLQFSGMKRTYKIQVL